MIILCPHGLKGSMLLYVLISPDRINLADTLPYFLANNRYFAKAAMVAIP